MERPLGIVVIGVGIAGRVRIRDLVELAKVENPPLKNVKLIGHVTRRPKLDIEGSEQMSLEEALARDDVDAVFICTENKRHVELTRQALMAGKHVLVEFPLALTAHQANDLLKLAKEKELIVYEEDISLLTKTHEKALEIVKEKGLKSVYKSIKGKPNGWIENIEYSGSPFVCGISMLHRVLQLCGDAVPISAAIDVQDLRSYNATALLMGTGNVSITLEYVRSPDMPARQTVLEYTLGDGTVINDARLQEMTPPSDPKAVLTGLFMQDTMRFISMVRGENDVTASHALTMRALQIADQLLAMSNYQAQKTEL